MAGGSATVRMAGIRHLSYTIRLRRQACGSVATDVNRFDEDEERGPHVTMDDEAMSRGAVGPMTGGMPPSGRSRGRLADEVYDTLLGQLMSLRIEPGSRVTIDVLARELGVSQTPIRDALNRMEAEGLVVRVPHAGYRIPPQITRHRFEDMLEVRLLLEPAAARRSAERASSEQVAGLRRMLEEMAELEGGNGPMAYGAFGLRDAAFHDLVALSAENQVIREALARLHTPRAPVPASPRHPGHSLGHGRARGGSGRDRRA